MTGPDLGGGIQKKKVIRSAFFSSFIQRFIKAAEIRNRKGGCQTGPRSRGFKIAEAFPAVPFVTPENNGFHGGAARKIQPQANRMRRIFLW